jgi:hypothetical protein
MIGGSPSIYIKKYLQTTRIYRGRKKERIKEMYHDNTRSKNQTREKRQYKIEKSVKEYTENSPALYYAEELEASCCAGCRLSR